MNRSAARPAAAAALMLVLLAAPMSLPAQSTATGEPASALAARLAEKRSQVEGLSTRLEQAKAESAEQLRALQSQRSELEAQLRRERLRLGQVTQDLDRLKERVREGSRRAEQLRPVVASTLAGLRSLVRAGLPFQVEQRLAEVQALERLLADGSLAPDAALARTWNLIESEFRLASESGIYRQTIEVGGEAQLAEVARLGMVLLYFRTFDRRTGFAVPSGGGWVYRFLTERRDQQQVAALFDMMRRNIREGYFELPNPLPSTGGGS